MRDRTRGQRMTLEFVVKKQTADVAELFGLTDRGTIACAVAVLSRVAALRP